MTKADFEAEAASSSTGTAGAAGVWNGVPVVVNYVAHSKYGGTPESNFHSQVTAYKAKLMGKAVSAESGGGGAAGGEGEGGARKFAKSKARWFE